MNLDFVRNWASPEIAQSYDDEDTRLYGLSLGYGSDPMDRNQLAFVYEDGLKTVPTMATTLCHPGFWIGDPRTGIDAKMAVHGEHFMRFHAPQPIRGTVKGSTRVTDIIDKGRDKGAIIVTERIIRDARTDQPIATIEQRTMCRGDGGFSAAAPVRPSPQAKPARTREGAAEFSIDIATLPQSALLYRLCADPNPLHADPAVARAAGFERPILQGLCTYGIAARAIIEACCDGDPDRLASLGVRFSAPVVPGETIRTEIWSDDDQLRFRCLIPQRGGERDRVVISNGVAMLCGRETARAATQP